jgi:hypothetical protein
MGDTVVVMHGRTFELGEPSADVTLRILNMIASLAMRAEKHVQRLVENPSGRAFAFGMLAVLGKDDLIRLGSAVLQFEDDRAGRKWLKENGVRIAPLVRALMINLQQSTDLVEAVRAFFEGLTGLEIFLDTFGEMEPELEMDAAEPEGVEEATE